ncbi:UDP-N-acetylglucosamine--N-acetylmuramyl-(pentapeptide) pyrophosphoryl-undecaprenol N-acetylglucosamine transferase, partial [Aquifex sp.]
MLLISGGGTGGHFFPALAFMEFLKDKEEIIFVGAKRGIEYKLKDKIPGEKTFLEVYPFRGVPLKERLRAIYHFIKTQNKIKASGNFKSVVFGGYASLPLGIYTIRKRKPLFIHEQNSIPSKTNKLLSLGAKEVFITFEHTKRYFRRAKKVGIPIRKELFEKIDKKEAKERLGLDPEKETLLILGGSQGALFLNRFAVELSKYTTFQIILISGMKHYDSLKEFTNKRFRILPFSLQMNLIYSASDFAISRAGAGTITELSFYGIPTLFIPYPYAADDHQYYNAKEIEELGGGRVPRQEEAALKKVMKDLSYSVANREEVL